MMRDVQVAVIGGGPAGLAAAIAAQRAGADSVVLIERNPELGGILNQCIHDGFGVERFQEALSGPEYAWRYIQEAKAVGMEALTDRIVTQVAPGQVITALGREGMTQLRAKALVLATGCRERTRGAIAIPGTRPAGVYTAGVAQHLVNMQNIQVGRRAVILGSGDIGLIMARRLTLEGVQVVEVLEKLPYCSGLARNVAQCLDDYNIPLSLSQTVVDIRGRSRVEQVVCARVDGAGVPVPGSQRTIGCDTLILSVGLIPENELARDMGVTLHPVTGGAVVDAHYMTSVPGVFACGNALHVNDLVDYVSEEGERAGQAAARFALGTLPAGNAVGVTAGEGVRYALPASLIPGEAATLSLRVTQPGRNRTVLVLADGKLHARRRAVRLSPAEMVRVGIQPLPGGTQRVEVRLDG